MQEFIKKDLTKSLEYLLPKLDVLRGKTILITGGTGFIGTWIVRGLAWLNDEYKFDCNIIVLARNPQKLQKIDKDLYSRKYISYIRSDIRSLHELPNDINYIIHAVGNPDSSVHMSDPVNTMDTISTGTKILLDNAIRLENLEGIIYLSSGQVYEMMLGSSDETSENLLMQDVRLIYPEAKRYSEILCLAYKSLYKLPVIIVRPFSFIGPFQELNRPWAVNSFLQQALNKCPIRIIGNGKPKRSYLYATDMTAWLLVILAQGKKGETYNLGSSYGVSLLDIANKINIFLKYKVNVLIQNDNEDKSKFVSENKYIKDQFGVEERFSFDEALEHTIKWNMKNLSGKEKK